MKKYIKPETIAIEVKTQQLMAGSDPALSGEYSGDEILSRELDDNLEW